MANTRKQTWNILPATSEDASSMVHLTTRTLAIPETSTQYKDIPPFVYPKEREHLTSSEDLLAHRIRTRKNVLTTRGIHTYKVVGAERIIGVVMWQEPVSVNDDDEKRPDEPRPPPPASLDQEAMRHVGETLGAVRDEIWGSGDDVAKYLYLMVFEVDPEFRRRGIATQLMQPLFKQADEAGLPIYVEASPLGKLFYQSCGFEVLKDVKLFDGKAMLSPMIRRAETSAAKVNS